MKKLIGIFLGAVLLIVACSKSSDNVNPGGGNTGNTFESFDRKGMLTNLGNNVIIPSFDNFDQKTALLQTAITTYSTDLSNEQKLILAQSAWIEAIKAWKASSVFIQGPITDKFLVNSIDYQTVSYDNIEKAITEGTTIDNAYVESKGATVKGFQALEYLLFDQNKKNSNIIGGYTGANGAKRIAYLKALITNLKEKSALVLNAWKPSGENYVAKFISADGRDINSSLGVLVNNLIQLAYTVRDERIGAPYGHRTNNVPQPNLVDGRLSDISADLAIAELNSIESALQGKTATGAKGLGIYDLLDKLEAKSGSDLLSKVLSDQFTTVYTKIKAIPVPLRLAVVNNPAQVGAAYDEVKRLQVKLEVDMVNNLGVLLTFSDNDGD
ncbi:Predicted lipoprotein [Pseudarcicella hirudinis]|uniref:Predicted lipoprotein n=1 Tax=Pseudarcicella hirudinis TaxID=1079859 RepID=A0A1I5X3H4_9BACT|nr:imelysin family protein [Pseudarcicella hirudinis]SFQ26533.1 Predicted lipoprotein [Pseudarcicella hirudinis]